MLNNRAYLEDAAEQTFVYLEGPHYPCGRNITELLLSKTGVDCLCATLVDVVEKWDAERSIKGEKVQMSQPTYDVTETRVVMICLFDTGTKVLRSSKLESQDLEVFERQLGEALEYLSNNHVNRPPTEPTDPAVLDLAPFLASMEGLRPRTKPTPFHKRTMQFERERNRLNPVVKARIKVDDLHHREILAYGRRKQRQAFTKLNLRDFEDAGRQG